MDRKPIGKVDQSLGFKIMMYLSLSHCSLVADKMDPFGPSTDVSNRLARKMVPAAKKRRESVEPRLQCTCFMASSRDPDQCLTSWPVSCWRVSENSDSLDKAGGLAWLAEQCALCIARLKGGKSHPLQLHSWPLGCFWDCAFGWRANTMKSVKCGHRLLFYMGLAEREAWGSQSFECLALSQWTISNSREERKEGFQQNVISKCCQRLLPVWVLMPSGCPLGFPTHFLMREMWAWSSGCVSSGREASSLRTGVRVSAIP